MHKLSNKSYSSRTRDAQSQTKKELTIRRSQHWCHNSFATMNNLNSVLCGCWNINQILNQDMSAIRPVGQPSPTQPTCIARLDTVIRYLPKAIKGKLILKKISNNIICFTNLYGNGTPILQTLPKLAPLPCSVRTKNFKQIDYQLQGHQCT